MSLTHKRIYGFAEFRLKVNARVLERDGNVVPLGAKAFEVLTCLVMDAGQVVTKETLLKTVWPEAFVTEANLSQQIFALRKAFGNRASFILTVPGRGYQFTEQVRELQELPPSTSNDVGSVLLQRTRERTRIVIEDTTETSTVVAGMSSLPSALEALRTHSRPAADPLAGYPDILRHVGSESAGSPPQGNWLDRRLPGSARIAAPLRRRGLFAGLLAVAVFLIMMLAWSVPRRYASTAAAGRRVMIAEFENRTQDPEFDGALRKALEVDLNQSAYLDVVSEPDLRATPGTAPIASAARQACQRSNRQVLITGSVATVGQLYLITMEAADCESGRLLASTKATVANKAEMLDSIDAASVRLRRALGEPETSVGRFQPPSAQH